MGRKADFTPPRDSLFPAAETRIPAFYPAEGYWRKWSLIFSGQPRRSGWPYSLRKGSLRMRSRPGRWGLPSRRSTTGRDTPSFAGGWMSWYGSWAWHRRRSGSSITSGSSKPASRRSCAGWRGRQSMKNRWPPSFGKQGSTSSFSERSWGMPMRQLWTSPFC